MRVVPGIHQQPVTLLQQAVQHVSAVGPVGVGSNGQVVVVDLDGLHGVERGKPVGCREREVVEPGVQNDHERTARCGPPDRPSVVVRRGRLEVQWNARGRDPVGITLLPRGGAELGAYYRGESFVAQGAGVGNLPAILCLEVVGEADKVVAGFAIGAYDFLRIDQAVGSVGVAVEVAAQEAPYFSALEQIPLHGSILLPHPVARYGVYLLSVDLTLMVSWEYQGRAPTLFRCDNVAHPSPGTARTVATTLWREGEPGVRRLHGR